MSKEAWICKHNHTKMLIYLDLTLQWLDVVDNFVEHKCFSGDLKWENHRPYIRKDTFMYLTQLYSKFWIFFSLAPYCNQVQDPGEASSFRLSSLFGPVQNTYKTMSMPKRLGKTKYDDLERIDPSISYSFSETVAVSSLTPSGSHMNVVLRSLGRLCDSLCVFLFPCTSSGFLCFNRAIFISIKLAWLASLCFRIIISFSHLKAK